MERLTMTSDKGGVAFTFDLDITCKPSEAKKILKLAQKLKEYEDAEEEGLLLRLPCKVGDTIYIIDDLNNMVLRGTVKDFTEDKIRTARGYLIHVEYKNSVISESWEEFSEVGKTVFLTKEEAEQEIAKMKEV